VDYLIGGMDKWGLRNSCWKKREIVKEGMGGEGGAAILGRNFSLVSRKRPNITGGGRFCTSLGWAPVMGVGEKWEYDRGTIASGGSNS